MRLRRLTGSLLTILTMHLNLLGADFACAKHAPADGDTEHGATEHSVTPHVIGMTAAVSSHADVASSASSHEMMASSAPSSHDLTARMSKEMPSCDVPMQPNCCKALASCNVVFSGGNELDVAGILNLPELVALNAMTAPPSERAAPDPPPPKA